MPRKICDHRDDFDRREALLNLTRALREKVSRDVHWHVGSWRDRFEQYRCFGLRAGAELDHN